MFTGIVDARARVREVRKKGRSLRLALEVPAAYRRSKIGASVSVDGVCLTVAAKKGRLLFFDVIPETVRRTTFGALHAGDRPNLERPLKWQGRVDGHLVQGHVDAAARVAETVSRGARRSFRIAHPRRLGRAIVEKGSVALNGVSLTVGRRAPGSFWVHVIPHTLKKTNLGSWKKGSRVNLETDKLFRGSKPFDNRSRGR